MFRVTGTLNGQDPVAISRDQYCTRKTAVYDWSADDLQIT